MAKSTVDLRIYMREVCDVANQEISILVYSDGSFNLINADGEQVANSEDDFDGESVDSFMYVYTPMTVVSILNDKAVISETKEE